VGTAGVEFTAGQRLQVSIGHSGLLAAPAFAAKHHNHSFVGRIGPVIVPARMALDHKSLQAADRMLARTAGVVTTADRSGMKAMGGNSASTNKHPAKAIVVEVRIGHIIVLNLFRAGKPFPIARKALERVPNRLRGNYAEDLATVC
jgi:hypothetical protein